MAAPHVSGVMAALAHQNPTLSAYEARDIVLDPGSFDALSDPRAQTTSTGGRLNFPKTLANPRLSSPIVLNGFPTLTMGPDVFAAAGSQVNLTANASDPDNDPLRMSWTRTGRHRIAVAFRIDAQLRFFRTPAATRSPSPLRRWRGLRWPATTLPWQTDGAEETTAAGT